MYTRPYSDDKSAIVIPESYGGTLFKEDIRETKPEDDTCAHRSERSSNPSEDNTGEKVHKNEESTETFSFLSGRRLPNFVTQFFKNSTFSLRKIGTEEVLIIATAAFLFFAKEGDKECAIMLLFLLFLG